MRRNDRPSVSETSADAGREAVVRGSALRRVGKLLVVAVVVTIGALGVAHVDAADETKKDEASIRALVEGAYFNGAFNDLDTEAMKRGFHEDFAIFYPQGNDLGRYEIATWIEGIESRKKAAEFDASDSAFEGKILSLDVTGGAASAKIELRKDGILVYTDYLSFLRFEDGWKIAAKVYHKHTK